MKLLLKWVDKITMAELIITRYRPTAAIVQQLRDNDRYNWAYLARRLTSAFASLNGRQQFVLYSLRVQFQSDRLVGPTGFIPGANLNRVPDSLAQMLYGMRRQVPELQAMGLTRHRALDQIKAKLVEAKILEAEQKLNTVNQSREDKMLAELQAKSGYCIPDSSLFGLFDEIDTALEQVYSTANFNGCDLYRFARILRGRGLEILDRIIKKGLDPAMYNELIRLQRDWLFWVEGLAESGNRITSEGELNYLVRRVDRLMQVAGKGEPFLPTDVILPYALMDLNPAAKLRLISELLGRGDVVRADGDKKLNYIGLANARLVQGEESSQIVIRGKIYDFSALAPCVLVPYMKHMELFAARTGEPLGWIYYMQPRRTSVKVFAKSDLRDFSTAERLIEVQDKRHAYIGGQVLSFAQSAKGSNIVAKYAVAFDGAVNLYDDSLQFLAALPVSFVPKENKSAASVHVSTLSDGLELDQVATARGRLRIDKTEYQVSLAPGKDEDISVRLARLRYVPQYARVYRSLGLAMLYSDKHELIGTFKIEPPTEGDRTDFVWRDALLPQMPKLRAWRARPDGLVTFGTGQVPTLHFDQGTMSRQLFAQAHLGQQEIELCYPSGRSVGRFPYSSGQEHLTFNELVAACPQVLRPTVKRTIGQGGDLSWAGTGVIYRTWLPKGTPLTIHQRPGNGFLPYVEAPDGRFILEHEDGSFTAQKRTVHVRHLVEPFNGLKRFDRRTDHHFEYGGRRCYLPVQFRNSGCIVAQITDGLVGIFYPPGSSDHTLDQVVNLSNYKRSGGSFSDMVEAPPEVLQGKKYEEIKLPYDLMHQAGVRVGDQGGSWLSLNQLSALLNLFAQRKNGQEEFVALLRRTGRSMVYLLGENNLHSR